VTANDAHLNKTYGNILLTARLGQGAMGAVYKGWHARFAREVAVKVLLDLHAKGSVKERFLREGRAAAKISHEHVVQVMDAGESDGIAYLVMELVDGYSLGRIVDEKGPLPCEAVARIGAQIALGLAAIHQQGIIHRDIKPDNILVGSDRKVKITDLGLAKQTDDPELNRLTATGMVVGTPLYVSPEAIRDPRSCTTAADIYSLGATLYHLLVGHPPFPTGSPYEVMRAHLEQRPQPIREVRADVPTGLAQLVERCLNKLPEKRPTALQVAELLSGGANLKASASRGLATLVGIASLLVAATASLAWLGLQHLRDDGSAVTASLVITTNQPDARVRVGSGPWQAVADGPLRLGAGNHAVEVRVDRSGPLLRFTGEVTLADHQRLELPVALAPLAVAPQRIPVAGDGMLYANGVAFGSEPVYTARYAGVYALGRWDGEHWRAFTATVDERGQVASGAVVSRDRPDGAAWWRTVDDHDQPLARHHVASWWEVDQVREKARLPPPPGWLAQGQRSEQPALGLSPGMVDAVTSHFGAQMALPLPAAALRLSNTYQSAVWSREHGRLAPVGGPAINAILVLVPVEVPAAR
jgi:serine/threonine-protein kinase